VNSDLTRIFRYVVNCKLKLVKRDFNALDRNIPSFLQDRHETVSKVWCQDRDYDYCTWLHFTLK